ncbi:hypothetical protein B0T17DRAFT_615167 [Bombardia bombarda]|uniref:Uncharacterized protein n=1 Tax=Bombardia bombarda TaxID=252184 RepID=A0AA39X8P5_9PEZI|nr:hypothetical protein B0T17DRAFT_615167 [Bombardia bombarda]
MAQSAVASDVVFLTAKHTVKPEEKDSLNGGLFLSAIDQLRTLPGVVTVFWGRSIEQTDRLAVVIRYTSPPTTNPSGILAPFSTTPNSPQLQHLRFSYDAGADLPSYPATEIAFPCFASDTPLAELEPLIADLEAALPKMVHPDGEKIALGWNSGWLAQPKTLAHSLSKTTGQAIVWGMFIGWVSREEHLKVTGTELFLKPAMPLIKRMLPMVEGLEGVHFAFRE